MPIAPAAPARLSTTSGSPSASPSPSATMRPTGSSCPASSAAAAGWGGTDSPAKDRSRGQAPAPATRGISLEDPQQVVMRVGEGRQALALLDRVGRLGDAPPGEELPVLRHDDLVGGRVPALGALGDLG